METKSKRVPARALRAMSCGFVLGDNGENAKTAPLELLARSGGLVDHWFWGKVVHDFQGMQHGDRIPVDWCHNDNELIGYVNKFNVGEDGLKLSGALVPYKESDRASEIVFKAKAGIPYEASIDFTPSKPGDTVIEEFPQGVSVMVNGQSFEGPITVFRAWRLRGVAVCPHGQDADTATTVQASDKEHDAEVMVMDQKKQEEKVEVKAPEAATQLKATEPVPKAVEASSVTAPEGEKAAKPSIAVDDKRSEFKAFVEVFGASDAAAYYSEGLDMQAAVLKHFAKLQADNLALRENVAQLTAKVNAIPDGTKPVPMVTSPVVGSSVVEPGDDELKKFGLQSMEFYKEFAKKSGSDPEALYKQARGVAQQRKEASK